MRLLLDAWVACGAYPEPASVKRDPVDQKFWWPWSAQCKQSSSSSLQVWPWAVPSAGQWRQSNVMALFCWNEEISFQIVGDFARQEISDRWVRAWVEKTTQAPVRERRGERRLYLAGSSASPRGRNGGTTDPRHDGAITITVNSRVLAPVIAVLGKICPFLFRWNPSDLALTWLCLSSRQLSPQQYLHKRNKNI